jgi:hypothetical protein
MSAVEYAETRLTFSIAERDRWRRGELQAEWRVAYPGLFDENDLRLALSQKRGHYFEWKAAIHYSAAGYRALLEKYDLASSHAAKFEVFNDWLGPAAGELIAKLVRGRGLPDLFVFRPSDRADWFFVEVKGQREPFGANQLIAFQKIVTRFGPGRLKVVRFHESAA